MPRRDAGDMSIYGIDPAWQHEVLSTWGGFPKEKVDMPDCPSADFTNRLRLLARTVKSQQQGSIRFLKSVPSGDFSDMESMLAAHAVDFGDVPKDVSVGDQVMREDVSSMYSFMSDVKWIYAGGGEEQEGDFSYTTETGGYAKYPESWDWHEMLPIFTPSSIYQWAWSYRDYSGGAFEHLTGGAWQRSARSEQNVTIMLSGMKKAMYDGVFAACQFVAFNADQTPQTIEASKYLILSASLHGDESGDCIVSVRIPSGGFVKNKLGVIDPPFVHDSGYVNRTISRYSVRCFLRLSDDYRV